MVGAGGTDTGVRKGLSSATTPAMVQAHLWMPLNEVCTGTHTYVRGSEGHVEILRCLQPLVLTALSVLRIHQVVGLGNTDGVFRVPSPRLGAENKCQATLCFVPVGDTFV